MGTVWALWWVYGKGCGLVSYGGFIDRGYIAQWWLHGEMGLWHCNGYMVIGMMECLQKVGGYMEGWVCDTVVVVWLWEGWRASRMMLVAWRVEPVTL